jgi:fatty-acyl-CoA synthase
VEDALLEHTAIADVAAFGVPDDDLGERLVAVVQLEPSFAASPARESELQAYCRERLGKIKAPKQIVFVATFPRLETGKLHKKRMREQFLRGELSPAAPMPS